MEYSWSHHNIQVDNSGMDSCVAACRKGTSDPRNWRMPMRPSDMFGCAPSAVVAGGASSSDRSMQPKNSSDPIASAVMWVTTEPVGLGKQLSALGCEPVQHFHR